MKQLNSNKTSFPQFDKILLIQPIAEMYGESNEGVRSQIAKMQNENKSSKWTKYFISF